jgi:hypothetical protein
MIYVRASLHLVMLHLCRATHFEVRSSLAYRKQKRQLFQPSIKIGKIGKRGHATKRSRKILVKRHRDPKRSSGKFVKGHRDPETKWPSD